MQKSAKTAAVALGTAVVCLAIALGVINVGNHETTLPAARPERWSDRADQAQAGLADLYWDSGRKLFNVKTPCPGGLCNEQWHYWWQAHALDVLVDAYSRTGSAKYRERIDDHYQGILSHNGGHLINPYYDDMEWLALALLRAYDVTGKAEYKDGALVLWEDIKTGWNEEQGGGIAWRKIQLDYKNTPANAPAVILAARLYRRFGQEDDLKWALRIYEWQKANLVDPESGFVWDGKNRTGDGSIDKNWEFTYCQGVFIGAGVELYRATGDAAFLADAARSARAAKARLTSPVTGVLPPEGDGDGGLFKGIFVRYLTELVLQDPSQEESVQLLAENADRLWQDGKAPDKVLFSKTWVTTPDEPVDLSIQLSGVMLLEMMAVLEKHGHLKP